VRWNYFSMSTPQVLQAISGKLFVREQAKATVQWNEMLEEIRDGLRLTFKELVDALVDKLGPKPDGTRKKLVGVDRLLEFLDTCEASRMPNNAAAIHPSGDRHPPTASGPTRPASRTLQPLHVRPHKTPQPQGRSCGSHANKFMGCSLLPKLRPAC
jgi:hypothetical protein